MPFGPVDPDFDLVALEERVLQRWREHDVEAESQRLRRDGKPWIFYEGPPTANGRPGLHHVWARVFKDLYPRFQTMRGHAVPRKGGWDCHGLPVELEVEKELGLHSKHEIEAYGVAEFNQRCRDSVLRYVEDWSALTSRSGTWIDTADAYWTHVERLRRVGLVADLPALAEGPALRGPQGEPLLLALRHRPVVPRAGPARRLPRHRRSVGLRPLPAARRPRAPRPGRRRPAGVDDHAVDAHLQRGRRGRARDRLRPRPGRGLRLHRARPRARRVALLPEGVEPTTTWKGTELVGLHYARPFTMLDRPAGSDAWRVVAADYVSTDDGTGIVHQAPAFGEEDTAVARAEGLPMLNPVDADGTFDASVPQWQGLFVKDADRGIIDDLTERGLLVQELAYTHSYPHCWRCGTPLIYWAKTSWFVRTSTMRDELLRENETINWQPDHIKHGRFGKWLEGNVDWALSRDRYWGTPMPIWKCGGCGQHRCVGSVAELAELSGRDLGDLDLHRPYVDEITLDCPECGGTCRRVAPVLDAWFDSGSMPSAQAHYPFGDDDAVPPLVPGRLHLRGHRPDAGMVLLAPRRQHVGVRPQPLPQRGLPEPDRRRGRSEDVQVAGQHHRALGHLLHPGRRRAALVLLLLGPAVDAATRLPRRHPRVDPPDPAHVVERLLLLLHLCRPGRVEPRARRPSPPMCSTGGSSASSTTRSTWSPRRSRASTRLAGATRLATFVDDLSNWYVRRSRPRFWKSSDADAHATLHECLVTTAQLLAPFCPFLADAIYAPLTGEVSVHLSDWPQSRGRVDATLADRGRRVAPPRRARPGRPHRGQGQGAPAPAPGPRAAPRHRAARRGRRRDPRRAQRQGDRTARHPVQRDDLDGRAQLPDARPPPRSEGERGQSRLGRGRRIGPATAARSPRATSRWRASVSTRTTSRSGPSATGRSRWPRRTDGPWPSTSRSTTSCVARARPASWSGRSTTCARRTASPSPIGSSVSLVVPPELQPTLDVHRDWIAAEILATSIADGASDGSPEESVSVDGLDVSVWLRRATA